jgi:WS/DGAT/MGAT family acyltransferase
MTVRRMTGMDSAFLAMETPDMHLHVIGTLLLDVSAVPPGSAFSRVQRALEDRIHLLAPFRRRAVAVPGGVDVPVWVEDPDFRLVDHLRRARLPAPGGARELEAFVGEVASLPLRRDRPLWELWVVEGLEDGSVALVTKLHHAMMDGAAGGELMAHLFDLSAEGGPVEAADTPWDPDVVPGRARLLAGGAAARVGGLFQVPRALGSVMWAAGAATRTWVEQRIGGTGAPVVAPRAPFNGSLTPRRAVAFGRCTLSDLKTVRRAFGTTINDVVLAATAAALRAYLIDVGELPSRALLAAVPVGVRADGADDQGGNHVSNMFVALPLAIADPVERLRAIHDSAEAAKVVYRAAGTNLLSDVIGVTAPIALSIGARAYSGWGLARVHPPVFNLIVSNVAGPPVPLFIGGMRVLATYPMGPLMEGSGLNLTILSDMGGVDVGVMACPDLAPDPRVITAGFEAGVAELVSAAAAAS